LSASVTGDGPLLAISGLKKSYGAVPALTAVDLAVGHGEIHALMGENGAGKSTLIKVLAGVVAPDAGTIAVDGQAVHIDSPKAAYRLGLRFIHQEFNVVPTLSVAENIFMGRAYPRRLGQLVDWRALNAGAQKALDRLGITHIDPAQALGRLKLGDQMLVRICAALLDDARLYVMDEPTAALTREESERLFTALRRIREHGDSVIYVSHRIDEVMALCDRATVLRDGRSIDSGQLSDITHDDLVAMMIGRRVEEAYPARVKPPGENTVLSVRDIAGAGFGPLSFDVHEGEVLGLAGLSGAGQREVLRAVFGDLKLRAGAMRLGDASYRPGGPSDAWASGLAYVPRERRSEGLMMRRPIFENVTLSHLTQQSRGGTWLDRRGERVFATSLGEIMRLKSAGPRQLVGELSGGNQQKVVFARALGGKPRLVLLDEPTRGVDVGAKFDIYRSLRELTAEGVAVILASSDLPELLGMADRIAVLREGRIAAMVEAEGLGEDELVNLCYGREPSLRTAS
jgi:ribose transport system ATP-binding protein